MNQEIIKLIVLLVVGLVVGVGGQILINKHRKAKKLAESQMYSNMSNSSSSVSEAETRAKDYITQYKSTYSKESIKSGLLSMGISDTDAENYLSKYL